MATTTENLYVGDGTTFLYSFTFPYISPTDIYVSLDSVDQTVLTEYTFANATTVQFLTPPTAGAAIRIYRNTSNEDLKAVFFPGSAIRASDLNDNFTQSLYVVQESTSDAGSAISAAEAAQASADASAASAAQAESDATAAAATANNALSNSQTALTQSGEAENTADTAVAVAVNASTEAEAAELKADQALAAVLEVVPFEVVANVAAIPASPENGEKVQVTDSTGIESFTPLTNLPAGFVGDPGIYVVLVFSTGSATWIYDSYNANDPDDRYSAALSALPTSGGTMTGPIVFDSTQTFPQASTTVAGDVQLSDSYAGTSSSLAVTEKALSDGLASVEIDIEALPALP